MSQIDSAMRKSRRERRRFRRKRLKMLLEAIESGKLDSNKETLGLLFNQKVPRQQYVSPGDRSTYNSGYMQIDEMLAGTPNVWR